MAPTVLVAPFQQRLSGTFPRVPCHEFTLEGGEAVSRLPAALAPESCGTHQATQLLLLSTEGIPSPQQMLKLQPS